MRTTLIPNANTRTYANNAKKSLFALFAFHSHSSRYGKGFTLLEVAITIGIVVLIGAISLVSFINSRNVRDLTTSAQNVLSVLRLAQSKALGGEDNSQWGVRLEQAQFILFRGTTFASSTSTQSYSLPSSIEIVNIILAGGGQEVAFKRLSGQTDQTGVFTVRIKGSVAQVFSVTVDGSGKVYQSGTAPAETGARVVDARHRSFNLGWSIQNSTTLTLTFSDPPNPNTVQNITMTPAPPRTTFDWTGTYSVGGQNQTLRVHATSITSGNTILHIDRDCRKNTKKVKISIDARDIATYETNCQTIAVGAYGGTMSEP